MVSNTEAVTGRSIKVVRQFYGMKSEAAVKGTAVCPSSERCQTDLEEKGELCCKRVGANYPSRSSRT